MFRALIQLIKKGRRYGCGRCHHSFADHNHSDGDAHCTKCSCKEYKIDRIPLWKWLK